MEAVRGIDVDEFQETVQAGINELRAAGTEVVLMNMQFSRETDAMIEFGPYLIAMRELAEANDVPLFRRRGICAIGPRRLAGSEGQRRCEASPARREAL